MSSTLWKSYGPRCGYSILFQVLSKRVAPAVNLRSDVGLDHTELHAVQFLHAHHPLCSQHIPTYIRCPNGNLNSSAHTTLTLNLILGSHYAPYLRKIISKCNINLCNNGLCTGNQTLMEQLNLLP